MFQPNFTKTPGNDALDTGWAEGTLSDSRPYRLEYWCQDQLPNVTFFLSTEDLELEDRASVRAFLELEGLVRFLTPEGSAFTGRWIDSDGNEIWSLNLVVGDEDTMYAEVTPLLQGYRRGSSRWVVF